MAIRNQTLLGFLMLALLNPVPVSAEDFGRLFMSREQRANLNDIRYQSKFAPLPEPAPQVRAAEPVNKAPVVSSLRINGMVRSSRGGGTVWLNNQQVERGGITREGISITPGQRRGDGFQIQLPSGVDSIMLKPGQKIDVVTGSVLEAYEADPQVDSKSAFARDDENATTASEPTTPESPANAKDDTDTNSGTLSKEQMLKILRQSAGKLSDTLGKAISQ
jgi:hypothetical protein